jgi:hypothetical protein
MAAEVVPDDLRSAGAKARGLELLAAARAGDTATLQRLAADFSHGKSFDPHVCERATGQSALLLLAHRGNVEGLRLLLSVGADPLHSVGSRGGGSPLVAAAERGYTECVIALLDGAGASKAPDMDVQVVPSSHVRAAATALAAAAEKGHLETVDALLARGAATDVHTDSGESALSLAAANQFPAVTRALLAKVCVVIVLSSTPADYFARLVYRAHLRFGGSRFRKRVLRGADYHRLGRSRTLGCDAARI